MSNLMTPERAIEILNPEHREHYDSIETVNEACCMGMEAIGYRIKKKPLIIKNDKDIKLGSCNLESRSANIQMLSMQWFFKPFE